MPITPDTKDWTWVLSRPCPDCGYDTSTFEPADVAAIIRTNGAAWPSVLRRTDVAVRPNADTWSPLEYAAHVRDGLRLMTARIGLMLEADDPTYPSWNQDETAVRERYGEQDPAVVSKELVAAAEELAATLEGVLAEAWSRTGRRSDGAAFTIASLARYAAHDPIHHLWDVHQ